MPKIKLKAGSPEYDDDKNETLGHTPVCDMPGCPHEAVHKAPKDRSLEGYYKFCMRHAQEYNNAWNYFAGMNLSDIENYQNQQTVWERPTWHYKANHTSTEDLYNEAWKTYNYSDHEDPKRKNNNFEANSPEFDAMAVMGLKPPLTLDEVKTTYKILAKKYHPDYNPGNLDAEEQLKKINMAYTVLKMAYSQYETLNGKDT